MYLKKLDIKGFKSFADTTEIHFFPGINVIVGPNGCGKSNIVDTVRWVLGEANVRNLRGQRNEDIIFSGTDQKRALGMANVTMIIDNADQGLPTEYGEVAIGRKVFRSGESEFHINRARVRLKDISALFAGTGLGKKGYSIIGQGELEQVLNGQPFERRLLLEEASGIIKYRQQREEVLNRMAAAGNDMEKLEAYLFSLAERRDELRGKAEKARAFQDRNRELGLLNQAVMEHELAETRRKYADKSQEMERVAASERLMAERILAAEEHERSRSSRQESLRSQIAELRENRYRLENNLDRLEAESRLQEERSRNSGQRLQNLNSENERCQRNGQRLEQEIARAREEYRLALQEDQEQHAGQRQLEQEIAALSEGISEVRSVQAAVRSAIDGCRDRERELLASEEQLRVRVREIMDNGRMAELAVDDNSRKEQAFRDNSALIRRELQEAESLIQGHRHEMEALREDCWQEQEKLRSTQEKAREMNKKRGELSSRLLLLEDQERNYAGYSEDVKALLRDQAGGRHRIPGIIGTAGSLIDVPPGLEIAVDVAGGRGLEDIVMESELDVRRAISYIKEKGLGRITFLPLDILKSSTPPPDLLAKIKSLPGVIGIASQLVGYDPAYQRAIDYLLGRVLIAESLDRAVEIFRRMNYGFRIVSLDGDILNASGAMTGGKSRRSRHSPLIRAAERRQLETELGDLEKESKKLQAASLGLESIVAGKHQRLEQINREKAALETRCDVLKHELAGLAAQIQECQAYASNHLETASQCRQEKLDLEKQINDLQGDLHTGRDLLEEKLQELEGINRRMESLNRDLAVRQERREAFGQQMIMKNRQLEQILAGLQQCQDQHQQIQEFLREVKDQMRQVLEEIEQSRSMNEIAVKEAVLVKEQLEQLDRHIHALNSQERSGLDEMQMQRAGLLGLKQEQQELANASRSLQMQKVRLETELELMAERWRETVGGEMPAEARSQFQAREIRESRVRIRLLQEELDSIGPVDLESIPAFEEIDERCEFVNGQYIDLKEARQGLERLLKETENIMVREFDGFLIEAGAGFKRTFMEIFGGGEASLVMSQHEDRLQAGIEIVVKMPGKRVQYLNLLSGGERALTCIAFIFALLRLKPAPFCLLDEIDAALDESNLLKFTRFLKRLAASIQFLVITHRQLTIEAGDCIYGVTMPQAGVSRVYSVKAEEAIEMAV